MEHRLSVWLAGLAGEAPVGWMLAAASGRDQEVLTTERALGSVHWQGFCPPINILRYYNQRKLLYKW
jgi:hypothetical protein